MAEEKNELDLSGFDDLGLDLNDFGNIGGDDDVKEDSRSPIVKARESFLTGVTKSVDTPKTVERIVDEALPNEYSTIKDIGDKTLRTFTSLNDDISKEITPALNEVKTLVNRTLPMVERFLPKVVIEKIKEATVVQGKDGRFAQQSEEEKRSAEIQGRLDDIFKRDSEDEAKDALITAYNEKREDLRTKATIISQEHSSALLEKLVSYQDKITANYQRQGLELQYKHFFVARDLFNITQSGYDKTIKRLDDIKKNTSLPDVQKIQKSEVWKEGFIGKIWGTSGESAASLINNFWDNTRENLFKTVKEKVDEAKFILDQATSQASMFLDVREQMGGGEDGSTDLIGEVASMGGEKIQSRAMDKALEIANKKLAENPELAKTTTALRYLVENSAEIAQELANKNYDNRFLDTIADFAKSVFPGGRKEEIITAKLRTSGLEPAYYDIITRQTIVEIIPGFLSRILQGITTLATGVEQPRTVYDSGSEQFVSITEAAKRARASIVTESDRELAATAFNDLFKEIDPDENLTETDKSRISDKLLEKSATGKRELFDPRDIYSRKFLGEDIDSISLERIVSAIAPNIPVTEDGYLDIKNPKLANIANQYRNIGIAMPNVQDKLNTFKAFGEGDILRETGLVKDNEVSKEFLREQIITPTEQRTKDSESEAPTSFINRWAERSLDTSTSNVLNIGEELDLIKECVTLNPIEKEFIKPLEESDYSNLKELVKGIYDKINDYKPIEGELLSPERDYKSEYETQKLEIFKDIAKGTWSTVDAVIESTSGNINLDEFSERMKKYSFSYKAGEGAKSLLSGLGSLARGAGGDIFSVSRGVGSLLKGAGSTMTGVAKAIPTFVSNLTGEMINDIYVNGEIEPRLLAIKLRKGDYINSSDKTVVRFIEDMYGEVVDRSSNMEVVITQDDYEKGFYIKNINGTIKNISSKFIKRSKNLYGTTLTAIKTPITAIKNAVKMFKEFIAVNDVYVEGEEEPRLLSIIMKRGGYFSQLTGKPILNLTDIDGAVVDSSGKVLLSTSELTRLFDENGKKIDINTFSESVKNFILKQIKGTANVTGILSRFAAKTVKTGVKRTFNASQDVVDLFSELIIGKKVFDRENKKNVKTEASQEVLVNKEGNEILQKIYDLLKNRIPEPENIVRGSWQEQFSRKKETKEKVEEKTPEQKTKSKSEDKSEGGLGDLLGLLGGINSIKGAITGALGGVGSSLATAASMGGAAAGAKSVLSTGGAAAAKTAKGIGTVLSTGAKGIGAGTKGALTLGKFGLKGLAAASFGVLSSPIVLGGIAAGVTGYGLYKGISYISSRKKPDQLEELKLLQYGIRKNEKDRMAKVRSFENDFRSKFYVKNKQTNLVELFERYAKEFDLNAENPDHRIMWSKWVRDRFLPIFLKYETALADMEVKSINQAEKLEDEKKREFVKTVTVDLLQKAYEADDSPFGYETLSVTTHEIETYIESLLASYGLEVHQDTPHVDRVEVKRIRREEVKEPDKEDKSKDIDASSKFNTRYSNNWIALSAASDMKWNSYDTSVIEKYRFLQYGINPNDPMQIAPIRALEEYLEEKYKNDIKPLTEIEYEKILKSVINGFPFSMTNEEAVEKWGKWYNCRFLPIFVRWIKFLNDNSLNSLKENNNLESLMGKSIIRKLIATVEAGDADHDPYSIMIDPFGGMVKVNTLELIDAYKKYLLSELEEHGVPMPRIDTNAVELPRTYFNPNKNINRSNVPSITNLSKLTPTNLNISNTNLPTNSGNRESFLEDGVIELQLPVNAPVSSNYGIRRDPFNRTVKMHKGVDYAAPEGTDIRAAADGEVFLVREGNDFGKEIVLKHKNSLYTRYAHMSEFNENMVKGEAVKTGELIGKVGSTGRSTGNHLHFELRKGLTRDAPSYDPVKHIKTTDPTRTINVEEDISVDEDVGGPDENFAIAESTIAPLDVENRTERLNVQRRSEHIAYMNQMRSMDDVLRKSLTVQTQMKNYLASMCKMIEENGDRKTLQTEITMSETVVPLSTDNEKSIVIKPPESRVEVQPKLSMRRNAGYE